MRARRAVGEEDGHFALVQRLPAEPELGQTAGRRVRAPAVAADISCSATSSPRAWQSLPCAGLFFMSARNGSLHRWEMLSQDKQRFRVQFPRNASVKTMILTCKVKLVAATRQVLRFVFLLHIQF